MLIFHALEELDSDNVVGHDNSEGYQGIVYLNRIVS